MSLHGFQFCLSIFKFSMLESYVTPLLMSYVSKYIKNIQPSDLRLSVWNGDVTLHKLDLRLDVIERELKMPFKVLSGHIHQLDLKIPWMNLGSEPVVITISTMELVLTLKPRQDSEPQELAQESNTSVTNLESQMPQSPRDQSVSSGYIQSFLTKIINNVSVNVNNFILKYIEDDIVFSLNLTALEFYSVDLNWEKAFVDVALSQNFSLRKLCYVSDLTMCLDKRNSNGVIESYQDPILYRCSFSIRMHIGFDSPLCKNSTTIKINTLFDTFHVSLSDVQFPMFLRLVNLIVEIYYGTLELPNRCVYIESDVSSSYSYADTNANSESIAINTDLEIEHQEMSSSTVAISETESSEEGWISWAWSRVPSVWSGSEYQGSRVREPRLLTIGLYATHSSFTFKPTHYTASRRLPLDQSLNIEAFGGALDINVYGMVFLNVDLCATLVTSSLYGFCSCGARDCLPGQPYTFLSMGEPLGNKVGPNYLTYTLFDDAAPENLDEVASGILNSESYFKYVTEERMKDVFGAFHFSYVFQLVTNECDINNVVYNPSERLLPYPETSWMKLTVYPCSLLLTSSVIHRLQLLTRHAMKLAVNYQPYSTPKDVVPTKSNQRLPSNLEWSILNHYISKRHKAVKILSPNVIISVSNHQHLSNSLPLLFEDSTFNPILPLFCIQLNCDFFQCQSTAPMYPTRVVGLLSTVPNLNKDLFDQCFLYRNANVTKLMLSICNMHGEKSCQQALTSGLDVNLTSTSLVLQNFWSESEIDCSNFYSGQSAPFEVYLNKTQLVFLLEFVNSNCLVNPKNNCQLDLASSSLSRDLFNPGLPKLHMFTSSSSLSCYLKDNVFTLQASLGHLNMAYFDSIRSSYCKVFTSYPYLSGNSEEKDPRHNFVEVRATFPLDFASNYNLSIQSNSFQLNLSSFDVRLHPLLNDWLGYQITSGSIAQSSTLFFLYRGEQVFSNYCAASVILTSASKSSQDDNYLRLIEMLKNLNFHASCLPSRLSCYLENDPRVINSDNVANFSAINFEFPQVDISSQGFSAGGIADSSRSSTFPWFVKLPEIVFNTGSQNLVLIKSTTFHFALSTQIKLSSKHEQSTATIIAASCHLDFEKIKVFASKNNLEDGVKCMTFLLSMASAAQFFIPKSAPCPVYDLKESIKGGNGNGSIIWRGMSGGGGSDLDSDEKSFIINSPNELHVPNCHTAIDTESEQSEHCASSPSAVKVSCFLQATINKLEFIIANPSSADSMVIDLNEISLIVDKHSSSLQIKLKISSVHAFHNMLKIFSSQPWLRYDTFCHSETNLIDSEDARSSIRAEEFLRRLRLNTSQPKEVFCSIIFTQALSQVVLQKVAMGLKTAAASVTNNPSDSSENYVSEFCVSLASFDAVIADGSIKVISNLLNFSPNVVSEGSAKMQSKAISCSKHTDVLCVRSLPLLNISLKEVRVCFPFFEEIPAKNFDPTYTNCLIAQLDSFNITPHTDRPIQRTILKNSLYTKSLLSGDVHVPGSAVEDRQYSLNVKNIFVGSVYWQDLLLSPEEMKLEALEVKSQNPALEWNRSEYLKSIIQPLKMIPILGSISIRSEFAPAIVTKRRLSKTKQTEFVIVSGHSAQVEISQVDIHVGSHTIKLIDGIVSQFGNSNDSAKVTDHAKLGQDSRNVCKTSQSMENQPNGMPSILEEPKSEESLLRKKFIFNPYVKPKQDSFGSKKRTNKGIPVEALLILSGLRFKVYPKLEELKTDDRSLLCFQMLQSFVAYKSTENDLIEISSYGFDLSSEVSPDESKRGLVNPNSVATSSSVLSCRGMGNEKAPVVLVNITNIFDSTLSIHGTVKPSINLIINEQGETLVREMMEFVKKTQRTSTEEPAPESSKNMDTFAPKTGAVATLTLQKGVDITVENKSSFIHVLVDQMEMVTALQPELNIFLELKLYGSLIETGNFNYAKHNLLEPCNISLYFGCVNNDSNLERPCKQYASFECDVIQLNVNKSIVENVQSVARFLSNGILRVNETENIEQSSAKRENEDEKEVNCVNSDFKSVEVKSLDDLRNGEMSYLVIPGNSAKTETQSWVAKSSIDKSETYPRVNEISFTEEDASETQMTWCYATERKLTRVEIQPMPFKITPGTNTESKEITIQLQYWNIAKQNFIPVSENVLSENFSCALISEKTPRAICIISSPMWRISAFCDETNVDKLISSISLAGCTRVDSETIADQSTQLHASVSFPFRISLQTLSLCSHSQVCDSLNAQKGSSKSEVATDLIRLTSNLFDMSLQYDLRTTMVSMETFLNNTAVEISIEGFFQNLLHVSGIDAELEIETKQQEMKCKLDLSCDTVSIEVSQNKLRTLNFSNLPEMLQNTCPYTYLIRNHLTSMITICHSNIGHFYVKPEQTIALPFSVENTTFQIALNSNFKYAEVRNLNETRPITVCLLDETDSRFYSVKIICNDFSEGNDSHGVKIVHVSNSFTVCNYLDTSLTVTTDLLLPKNKVLVKSVSFQIEPCPKQNSLVEQSSNVLSYSLMLPLPTSEEIALTHLKSKEEVSTSVPLLKPETGRPLSLGRTKNFLCDVGKSFNITLYPQYVLHNCMPFELTLLCSASKGGTIEIHVKPHQTRQLLEFEYNVAYEAIILTNRGCPLLSQPAFTFSCSVIRGGRPMSQELAKQIEELTALVKITPEDQFIHTNDLSVNMIIAKSPNFSTVANFFILPKVIVMNRSSQGVSVHYQCSNTMTRKTARLGDSKALLMHEDCLSFSLTNNTSESNRTKEERRNENIVVQLLQDEVCRSPKSRNEIALKLRDNQIVELTSISGVKCFLKLTSHIVCGSRVITLFDFLNFSNFSDIQVDVNFCIVQSKKQGNLTVSGEVTLGNELSQNTIACAIPKQRQIVSLNPWPQSAMDEPIGADEKFNHLKLLQLKYKNSLLSECLLDSFEEHAFNIGNDVLSLKLVKTESKGPDNLQLFECARSGLFVENKTQYTLLIGNCEDTTSLPFQCDEFNPYFLTVCSPGEKKFVKSSKYICISNWELVSNSIESSVKSREIWSDHVELCKGSLSVMVPGIPNCLYGEINCGDIHHYIALAPAPFVACNITHETKRVTQTQAVSLDFSLKLLSVSISVDDSTIPEEHPSEIFRATLENIEVAVTNPSWKNEKFNVKLGIDALQLDNQLAQTTSMFDFTTVFIAKSNDDCNRKAFQFISAFYFDGASVRKCSLKLRMGDIRLFFEDAYAMKLYIYALEVQKVLSPCNKIHMSNPETCNQPQKVMLLPVESLEIDAIDIKLSARANIKVYLSLDSSPLYFRPFKQVYNCQVDSNEVIQQLVFHYGSGMFLKAGMALASLDIIGNPAGFVRELKEGFKNLLIMPYDGLTRSPSSFVTGIAAGGASCVKHISSGTLGCLVNMSFSIAKNLDRLSMDNSYSEYQNQLRRKKPVYFSNGVMKGMTGLGIALLGAVAGVVNLPLETMANADENCSSAQLAGHVIKGMSAGLVGVVAKPLGGAADFVAHTGQGLMTTTGLINTPQPKQKPKHQLDSMTNASCFLLNSLVSPKMSQAYPELKGEFFVQFLANATLGMSGTANHLTACLCLCEIGCYLWLRKSMTYKLEPSLVFYPFFSLAIFADDKEQSTLFARIYLSGSSFICIIDFTKQVQSVNSYPWSKSFY